MTPETIMPLDERIVSETEYAEDNKLLPIPKQKLTEISGENIS